MSILFEENKSPDKCTVFVYAIGGRGNVKQLGHSSTENILLPVVQHRGHIEKPGKKDVE